MLARPDSFGHSPDMSAEPDQEKPEETKVGEAGGRTAKQPPAESELPEPASPPCYLHEFPPPQPNDVPTEAKPVSELTPEEQMERFEKELKETDWGHQPC